MLDKLVKIMAVIGTLSLLILLVNQASIHLINNNTSITGDLSVSGIINVNGIANAYVPRGVIVAFNGQIADIPAGWLLCNGSNGTPDLRSRFIVGAGQGNGNDQAGFRLYNYNLNDAGGEQQHYLSVDEMPRHAHSGQTNQDGAHRHEILSDWIVSDDADDRGVMGHVGLDTGDDAGHTQTDGNHVHNFSTYEQGGGASHNNLPPYYALVYIMKQ